MNEAILRTLKERGYDTVKSEFYSHIDDWKDWYESDVPSFHKYKVYNGQEVLGMRRYSMGMAKKGCEDWANLLMNEKVAVTLEGETEQRFIDATFRANNFYVKSNEMQELKAALGTSAYVPRAMGVSVSKATGDIVGEANGITIDYITAENVAPLSWENGFVTECAFASKRKVGDRTYTYLQIHRIGDDGNYDIENVLYLNDEESLTELPLASVDAFKNVPKIIHTGSPHRQFVIDRMNLVNNIDPTLPMGVSIFANSIDCLKGCDIAFDAYVNEFILGKKRIMVKPEAVKGMNGEPLFDPNDTCFYILPEDSQSGQSIHEINMSLRTNELNQGIQDMLNVLSAKLGFGENHYQFNRGSLQTATQVVSENSTLFRSIKKHELILGYVLEEICRILLRMGNTYMGLKLNEDVEITIDFDDSIIEDKSVGFQRDVEMVQLGVFGKDEFRAKWINEAPETAKKALEEINADLIKEQQMASENEQKAQAEAQAAALEAQQSAQAEARQFELEKLRLQQEHELRKLQMQQEFELQKLSLTNASKAAPKNN